MKFILKYSIGYTIIIPDRNSKKQFNKKLKNKKATGWTKYKYKFYKYI